MPDGGIQPVMRMTTFNFTKWKDGVSNLLLMSNILTISVDWNARADLPDDDDLIDATRICELTEPFAATVSFFGRDHKWHSIACTAALEPVEDEPVQIQLLRLDSYADPSFWFEINVVFESAVPGVPVKANPVVATQ